MQKIFIAYRSAIHYANQTQLPVKYEIRRYRETIAVSTIDVISAAAIGTDNTSIQMAQNNPKAYAEDKTHPITAPILHNLLAVVALSLLPLPIKARMKATTGQNTHIIRTPDISESDINRSIKGSIKNKPAPITLLNPKTNPLFLFTRHLTLQLHQTHITSFIILFENRIQPDAQVHPEDPNTF